MHRSGSRFGFLYLRQCHTLTHRFMGTNSQSGGWSCDIVVDQCNNVCSGQPTMATTPPPSLQVQVEGPVYSFGWQWPPPSLTANASGGASAYVLYDNNTPSLATNTHGGASASILGNNNNKDAPSFTSNVRGVSASVLGDDNDNTTNPLCHCK